MPDNHIRSLIVFALIIINLASYNKSHAQCNQDQSYSKQDLQTFASIHKEVNSIQRPDDKLLFALAEKHNIQQGSMNEENLEQFKKDHPEFIKALQQLESDYKKAKIDKVKSLCEQYQLNSTQYEQMLKGYKSCRSLHLRIQELMKN